ncbi:hypothetical protein AAMO2058_000115100 [Amorphochlora amoebiformis]
MLRYLALPRGPFTAARLPNRRMAASAAISNPPGCFKPSSLTRTTSMTRFLLKSPSNKTSGPQLTPIGGNTVESQDGVPSLTPMEEVELASVTSPETERKSKKNEDSSSDAADNIVAPQGKRFAGDVTSKPMGDDPLHRAGFQTVLVSLEHPLVQLQRWVVAGLVHWENDGVKQISNALMYFMTASEIQLLTVDGPVPSSSSNVTSSLSINLEPLKRIRYVAQNRGDIKISQYKRRILEDIVEAKAYCQNMQMPPCFAWPFAMAWWNKCTKKRKHMDEEKGGTVTKDGKEGGSIDFTKCYGCGTQIKKAVFMYLDHSFCSEKCRTRQMRRPYRTYTANKWHS